MAMHTVDPFETQMIVGHRLGDDEAWHQAYRCFARAHDLGHGIRTKHLAAHRAALRAAVRTKRPERVLYQLVFLGFASLTSWNH